MKAWYGPAYAALLAVAVAAIVLVAGCGGKQVASPTHVTAVFFDGVNHGDFRETCSVWQEGRKHMARCEAYLAFLTASGGSYFYRVVPHSEKGWREGSVEVASVKVRSSFGNTLTARLVKTRHGWLVVSAA